MTVRDVQNILEGWAPRGAAWERDNVGLQVGEVDKKVKKILVTLDINEEIVREAEKKSVDLIVSHHPLLFRPLTTLTPHDRVGKIVFALAKHGIALYSMHTNFDFTYGGVSFSLAKKLGLRDVTFLKGHADALRKLAVFVPADHVDGVAKAMAAAGAGVIGRYEDCSFRIEGIGTFRGGEGTQPFVGQSKQFEKVGEIRLEMVVPKWKVDDVVRAMKEVHPYEEVAYDVYVLENDSVNFGVGAFGALSEPTLLGKFLTLIKRRLKVPSLRFNGNVRRSVRNVAVCGGSGSEFLEHAIHRGADAFITADVKYHAFESAAGRIALIDAGHFETEHPSVDTIVRYMQEHPSIGEHGVQVFRSSMNTNPVYYH
jgi:dinuclear metal center YbgI/SA1388 family protein